jgi:hypothetical protein
MSLVADFLTNGVAPFMNAHTLSLPGALIDGGTIDYTDPAYAARIGSLPEDRGAHQHRGRFVGAGPAPA